MLTHNKTSDLNKLSDFKLKLIIFKLKLTNIKNNVHLWVGLVLLITMWYPIYCFIYESTTKPNVSVLIILLFSFLFQIFILKEFAQPFLDDKSCDTINKINEIKNIIKQKNQD